MESYDPNKARIEKFYRSMRTLELMHEQYGLDKDPDRAVVNSHELPDIYKKRIFSGEDREFVCPEGSFFG